MCWGHIERVFQKCCLVDVLKHKVSYSRTEPTNRLFFFPFVFGFIHCRENDVRNMFSAKSYRLGVLRHSQRNTTEMSHPFRVFFVIQLCARTHSNCLVILCFRQRLSKLQSQWKQYIRQLIHCQIQALLIRHVFVIVQ